MAAMLILTIYSIPKIYRMPDISAILSKVYSKNMQRIYDVLETKKAENTSSTIFDLMHMPVNMFHDGMKQNGRHFTPELAQRITVSLNKIEKLPA